MIVMRAGDAVGHYFFVVVVNIADHANRMPCLRRFLARFFQCLPNQVANRFGAILVAYRLDQLVKIRCQVVVERNGKAFQCDPLILIHPFGIRRAAAPLAMCL